ncbi:MAG: maleylpyruvate isomerase family mycothiol-dependent enzyme [Actinobacteria bacterium]|nr:maleylpyruvate isomerase family mycothiol-dependent enzyme [Actinomycetota bacterium]MBV8960946.1 maleylpyruvate isomerase family mycothiol-dependent enzyme [Actinomycetota bacterium]MBV9253279.1 maleylpyruvate isomerase family mycothiol-dependent enzyme [Actinomycetota bacterium]MBV9665854.1 maleylpyruvate isomerase family mycothiol-dependent enzyme [Actinomycetota bacterium]MBV9936589.1 maleylpyruvate isomerase family mycothiol-dependent enzyme [Actinomycetota bacterium]
MADYRRLHDDENADFCAYLTTLTPEQWEAPSLCEGWRVRDVVGHILYGNELNLFTLPFTLARHGFSSDRSGKVNSIARAEGRSTDELLRDFTNRDPWAGTPRIFGARLTLLDRLVHHQDIRRALGHRRDIPEERVLPLVEQAPTLGSVFGGKRRSKGLRLEATDMPFTRGDAGAPLVRGPGEALLMAVLGRKQATADLEGDGLEVLAGRA